MQLFLSGNNTERVLIVTHSCAILRVRGQGSSEGVIAMKVEEGTIVSVFADGSAEVKVGRHSDCIACGACEGANDIVVTALNPVNAQEGQHVKFEFHDTNIVVGAFICFVMPLLLAAAGAVIGYLVSVSAGTEQVQSEVIGAVIAFLIGLGGVKYFDHSLSKNEKSKPKIIEIITA